MIKSLELRDEVLAKGCFNEILNRDTLDDILIMFRLDLNLKDIIEYKNINFFLYETGSVNYDDIVEKIAKHILKKDKLEKYYEFISTENILENYNKGKNILFFQYEHVNSMGKISWCSIIIESYFDIVKKKIYSKILIKDITYRKKIELSLDSKIQLHKDTGLYNNKTIKKIIENEIKKKAPCLMGILSVNNKKEVLEKIGKDKYKELFLELAENFKINLHSNVLLGNIDEDKIIIFSNSFSKDKLKEKIEKIYLEVFKKENNFSFTKYFKFSLGIGCSDGDKDADKLYAMAYEALLNITIIGKDSFHIYDEKKNNCKKILNEVNKLSKEEYIFKIIPMLESSCDFETSIMIILENTKNYFQLGKIKINLKINNEKCDLFNRVSKEVGINEEIKNTYKVPMFFNSEIYGYLIGENFKVNKQNEEIFSFISYLITSEYLKYKCLNNKSYTGKYDELTGLLNHSSYGKKIDKLNLESLSSLGVLYIDINGFKNINLVSGREYGDNILKEMSNSFNDYFQTNLKFRLYGDIFFLLFEDLTYKKFEEDIKNWKQFVDENFLVSVSIGKAWSDSDINLNKLCINAEEFLKYSKEEHYDKKHIEELQKFKRKTKFMKLLKDGNYKMHLQPKANAENGEIFGAEALTRFYLNGEIQSPYKFIPQLERDGFIKYLDKYIFEEVCKLLEKWKKEGKKLMKISLNFSRLTFMTSGIVEEIIEISNKYNIPRKYIEIEMTETIGELDKESIKSICSKITKEGFLISLDDFGAKYSNMAVLIYMYFNTIKIDKSLINDVITNDKSKIIIRNIFKICKELKIDSIAEGVETEEQFIALKKLGCKAVQGYLFNKPISVSHFEELYIK
ncbi:MAG: EAL domain-containing protein [Fusobacterium sp.]